MKHFFCVLDPSKLKKFADDNFKFDENGSKLSKLVENTEGKGEIARYEQFLLSPQCFQKACFSKGVIVWECIKEKNSNLVLRRVESIAEKGGNAGYQHFSVSHNVF